jgi:SAM-dependent methyltransferase
MTKPAKNRGIPPSFFAEFYQTPCGLFTAEQLTRQIAALWPDLKNLRVLALGWPFPYLTPLLGNADSVVVATPHGTAEDTALLHMQNCAAALVEPDVLPFYARSFDRILMVHSGEYADSLSAFFEQAEELLRDDGRMISVLPNRSGFWHSGTDMPFTGGHAVSENRHTALLEDAGFSVEYRSRSLFMPPVKNPLLLRFAALYEKAGNIFFPFLCGVHLCEARKDILSGAAVQPVKRTAIAENAELGAVAE